MMDGVLVAFGFMAMLNVAGIALLVLAKEGTKGIQKEAYYGKKTGMKYTAKKLREGQIV
jgi:hypothetical protein